MTIKLSRYSQRIYERMRAAGYKPQEAHFIASEHQRAHDEGITVEWEEDQDGERDDDGNPRWICFARNEDGEVTDSLGGIDLGEVGPDAHHSDSYQYDAEAQVINASLD